MEAPPDCIIENLLRSEVEEPNEQPDTGYLPTEHHNFPRGTKAREEIVEIFRGRGNV